MDDWLKPLNHEQAEAIAVQMFNFIVADTDRIIQFLNVTGLQPETIRESAKSSLFLLGVLDYASKDEELLKAFHEETKIRPAEVLVACVCLTPKAETPEEKSIVEAVASLPRRPLFH